MAGPDALLGVTISHYRILEKLGGGGHTVPAVETLEKFARALEVPMYVLFYDGDEPNSR